MKNVVSVRGLLLLLTNMMKIVLYLLVAVALYASAGEMYEPVLLKEVKSLRFVAGQYALNTRDSQLIPQLECAYTPIEDPTALPVDVLCTNMGLDHTGSIVWSCNGIMADNLEFDRLQVSCEGYDHPGDEYVKDGSCALKYTLKIATTTPQYDNDNNNVHHHQPRRQYNTEPNNRVHQHYTTDAEATSGFSFTTVLIFVLIVALIIKCCVKKGGKKTAKVENCGCENCEKTGTTPVDNNYNPYAPSAPPSKPDGSFVHRDGFADTTSR